MNTKILGSVAIALLFGCAESTFSGSNKPKKPSNANGQNDNGDWNGADGSKAGGGNGNGANGSVADNIFGGGFGSSSSGSNGGLDGANGGAGNNGGANGGTGGAGNNGGANGGTGGAGNNGGADGGNGGAGGGTVDGGNGAIIPDNCKNQKILIEDFKSGWWDDDGGNMYDDIIKKELSEVCKGTTTTVEYHHWQPGHGRAKFYDAANFAEYTQVWVLSGTSVGDMKVDDPTFVELMSQIRTHKPNLFIGAGFGSLPQANAAAEVVWGQPVFKTEIGPTYSVKIFEGSNNFSITSRLANQVTGNILQGVKSALADQIVVTGVNPITGGSAYTASDEIISTMPGVKVVGQCNSGPYDLSNASPRSSAPPTKPNRVMACIAVAQHNGFNVVLDSGLQRFYGMYLSQEADVRTYMRNIARALAL